MILFSTKIWRWLVMVVVGIVLVGVSVAAAPFVKHWAQGKQKDADPDAGSFIELVTPTPLTVRVDAVTIKSLDMQTAEVKPATEPRHLRMIGQLAIDTDHLIRIKPFFAGTLASIAPAKPEPKERVTLSSTNQKPRPLHQGDPVKPNQLLATYYSKDLGQAKSAVVDAWSRLLTDQRYLERLRSYAKGAVPEKTVWDAERQVDADRIAVNAAERQLRAWQIPESEIRDLEKEGQRGGVKADKDQWKKWATFEIRAPNFPGIIVEKNGTESENIDPSSGPPLFQIADYRRMAVYAYPYEEDLPALQKEWDRLRKQGKDLTWNIALKADPDRKLPPGKVDKVLPILDPYQKTPILRGYVDDPKGNLNPRLLSTMSVTATIELPARPGEVVVPATALVDDGQESIVFVQRDVHKPDQFTLQPVEVVARYADKVFIRAKPNKGGQAKPLEAGQSVLVSGGVELKEAVDNLPTTSAQK